MKAFTILFSLAIGAVLSALLFLWMASGEIYDYQDNFVEARDGKDIDVVLCLAGGKGRIPTAVNLWQRLKSERPDHPPVLFFSGVGPQTNLDMLIEQGVPKDVVKSMKKGEVILETVSTNTYENGQIFFSFVRQKQWKNILVVTASYHMRRSANLVRKGLGSEVNVFTYTMDSEKFDRLHWHQDPYSLRVTMMEYLKWIFYRYSY